ncbi:conserved hypothetical protein [Ricinus communis]|uniref:RNase H type-1 domain-containing protein n=1 Tax=Ricinus communis TaxID=3988 RepID=B9SUM0_RICCO|nr:conserved hypothetical protein [Ricinus communis]
MVMARADRIPGNYTPREAEAISIREALSWLKQQIFEECIIESDALQVIEALKAPSSQSCFHLIIDDCKHLVQHFRQVHFQFVRRSANTAAQIVARGAYSLSGPMDWFHILQVLLPMLLL